MPFVRSLSSGKLEALTQWVEDETATTTDTGKKKEE